MDVSVVLLGIAGIIFFGFLAELIFKKTGVPDVLLLVILGFIIGPNVLGLIDPSSLSSFMPIFTTFALLFLMFEGSLSIDLGSFARGLFSGSMISFYNFIISAGVVAAILNLAFGFDTLNAILMGFIFGGISSAFVIPVIKQLNPRGELFTIMTLEAALTDVYTIVFSLTVLQIIKFNSFSAQQVLTEIISLFAIAFLIGVFAAILWMFLDKKIFNNNKSYMTMIAYIILIYLLTDFLGGNGAIATMFFGITLKNSKQITSLLHIIKSDDQKEKEKAYKGKIGTDILSESEHLFFNQISFFLKIFFFVYIGLLLNISNHQALAIGAILAIAVMISRRASMILTKSLSKEEKSIINAIFARGLAAAAVAQIIISSGVAVDPRLLDITYVFIIATIILSSVNLIIYKVKFKANF